MNTLRLVMAAAFIQQHLIGINDFVSGIQFEDGSGNKFNYQVSGRAEWHYVDLTHRL